MDRQIVYPGQILPETSLLQMAKDAMIGVAKLSAAVLGTSTMANGFAVTPTGPASLQVICAPGEIYSLTSIDALAFSTLPADTTHSIMKQGILLDGVTLSCPAPGTTGQSINYLVQVTYQDTDSTPVLLPYYNSANPAMPYSGMGNNGLTQNTNRKGAAVVAVKAGASAVTGSQVTPAPDAGYIGLYVVTVAFGQTTITAGNIAQYSGAPLLPAGLLQSMQSGQTLNANDIGTANTYAANFTPAITSLTDKMRVCIKVANANTAASTFTPAPGVIAAAPIVGAAHAALQGGEMVATGDAWLQWNSSVGAGSWVLTDATGGGAQVATATKSQHAVPLGQAQTLVAAGPTLQGLFKNLVLSTTGLSAVVTVSADELVVENSSNQYQTLRGISIAPSFANAGANGLDVGAGSSQTVLTWYYVWVIWNGTTTAGLLSLSSTAPTLPSGYTHKARVGAVRTDNTGSKFPFSIIQYGRRARYKVAPGSNTTILPVVAAGVQGTIGVTAVIVNSVALPVPPTAASITVSMFVLSGTIQISPNSNVSVGAGSPAVTSSSSGGNVVLLADIMFETPAIYYAGNVAAASCTASCAGWEDTI
ncbi:hypothetical protein NTD84_03050 [Pseudomonas sp. 14P_8.1_Bac3]|uniref:hypothetical protein n=1 Tax=Pseudomonas sp. 14P_8.1_Bac3 TaxID=2971621 RepID=UPI0021C772C7|nr:hypothetical protein [Pseudomonas sp. 14P_8.1_Bac3]MCU1758697.1 hypothetical protein [Pseudomonas sp. 14P_8.1_Bac3]